MKKLNNKGFAISTMLYGLLILIVLIIAMILSTMAFNRKNSREFSEQIVENLETKENYFYTNQNIVVAYTYDANNCVTGDEDACQQISLTTSNTNIPAGTIIKYKVNDTDIVTFHVMYDNGSTLTMQSQKNIVDGINWISTADYGTDRNTTLYNDKGPLTILNALEKATSNWTNVNDQTYTMGTTEFIDSNRYTGCSSYTKCNTNTYTLASRTAKARMITVLEARRFGCTQDSTSTSCSKWVYNNLSTSAEADAIRAYYTMNTRINEKQKIFIIHGDVGRLTTTNVYCVNCGARAVVVINK